MANIGTTFTNSGKKAVLCGSGELGKEVALELQRYGVEVVALDKYENAPAMHVAHRSHVLSMLDGEALKSVIQQEKPDYIIPEIEAIATDKLVELEAEGYNVVPTARATRLTMNREGIRRLAAETLGLPTSPYRFAETHEMDILTEYLFGEGRFCGVNDCTDYVLPLQPGDIVSVVEESSRGYFVKHRGISGWYFGALEKL